MATTPFHHAWLPTHLRSRGIGRWTHWCFLTHCSHREAFWHSKRVHCTSFSSGRATWRIMVRVVDMSVLVHTTAPCSICPSVSVFVVPPCPYGRTSEHAAPSWHHKMWNNSYYTGVPLSALQISASTRESHGAATSSFVSCPQVTHSAISPQVQTGPTRTVTSDLMSATLAEAATQLSCAAFLERCISASASPRSPLPHPSPLPSGCHHADYSTPPFFSFVSFHIFLLFVFLAFLLIFLKGSLHSGISKERHGRSRHRPTKKNQFVKRMLRLQRSQLNSIGGS